MSKIVENVDPERTATGAQNLPKAVQRTSSLSYSQDKERALVDSPYVHIEQDPAKKAAFVYKYRPFLLTGLALVIFGWWISATILKATRHRW